jgi:predicted TIM-barrel fold metal-dependent hydrolase
MSASTSGSPRSRSTSRTRQKHLRSLIEWVGVDRLLFSSDYPHWDFDDPRFAFKTPLTEAERAKIFNGNARALYKL